MKTITGKFFQCECYHDGIFVQHDPGFGTEISLFKTDPQNRSFKNRLLLAWECLKGKPYTDMVILDDQKIADLVDYLTEIQNLNYKSTT
jgi:hypothetical protein